MANCNSGRWAIVVQACREWEEDIPCSAGVASEADQTGEEERGYLSDSPTYHSGNLDEPN
jgi:hypothetical protein